MLGVHTHWFLKEMQLTIIKTLPNGLKIWKEGIEGEELTSRQYRNVAIEESFMSLMCKPHKPRFRFCIL